MWEFKGASGSCESVCGQYEIHDIKGKFVGNYEREDSPLTPSTRSSIVAAARQHRNREGKIAVAQALLFTCLSNQQKQSAGGVA